MLHDLKHITVLMSDLSLCILFICVPVFPSRSNWIFFFFVLGHRLFLHFHYFLCPPLNCMRCAWIKITRPDYTSCSLLIFRTRGVALAKVQHLLEEPFLQVKPLCCILKLRENINDSGPLFPFKKPLPHVTFIFFPPWHPQKPWLLQERSLCHRSAVIDTAFSSLTYRLNNWAGDCPPPWRYPWRR